MTRSLRPPIIALRWPIACGMALLAAVPVLLTRIPPLTDVAGHIGRLSVQTAPAGDPVLRYFDFHWALTLNLAADLIVQWLHPLFDVLPTVRVLSAATPALTVVAIVLIARQTNRHGAHALPWSLLFVFNLAYLWGFLNYTLTMAVGLIAFALWLALDRYRRSRAALFLVLTPLLFIGHGVAGVEALALIVGYQLGTQWHERGVRSCFAVTTWSALWPPIVAAAVTLIVWKAIGSGQGGPTLWLPQRKIGSLIEMLRDQAMILDIATVLGCGVVWIAGIAWKARLRGGAAGAVIALLLVFLATPSLLGGSDDMDARLAPFIPMVAFAMQDWSAVRSNRRRWMMMAGFALLATRFAVTAISFHDYDRRYAAELAALDHVRSGSRVFSLVQSSCDSWRADRLDHLSALATTIRGAWVNAHWSVGGLHLLQVRYRPSPSFYKDPSQFVYPAACAGPGSAAPGIYPRRRTLVEAIHALPLGAADYLWIIHGKLPRSTRDPRLRRIWSSEDSELYRIAG